MMLHDGYDYPFDTLENHQIQLDILIESNGGWFYCLFGFEAIASVTPIRFEMILYHLYCTILIMIILIAIIKYK